MADGRQEARAEAKAAKARAKALRPWYRKKRYILGMGVGLIVLIVIVASLAGDDDGRQPVERDEAGVVVSGLDADGNPVSYPDQQDRDHVAGAAGTVEIFGVEVTATNLHRISPEFGDTALCVDVALVNTSSGTESYNEFDFKLQTPSGDVRSFDLVFGQENNLGSGDLVAGGTRSGTACFEDARESGQYVLIYKPKPFDATRGIWLFDFAG